MALDPRSRRGCPDDDDCIGGYRSVTDAYVDALVPPLVDVFDAATGEFVPPSDAVRQKHASDRAAARHSSFPCPTCNPDQFLAWQDGAWPYPARRAPAPAAEPAPLDLPFRADLA